MWKRKANGLAIKAIREAYGYPGGVFATRCGISHAYLSNIESGRRFPPPEVLKRIADELGQPIAAISYTTFKCEHAHDEEQAA